MYIFFILKIWSSQSSNIYEPKLSLSRFYYFLFYGTCSTVNLTIKSQSKYINDNFQKRVGRQYNFFFLLTCRQTRWRRPHTYWRIGCSYSRFENFLLSCFPIFRSVLSRLSLRLDVRAHLMTRFLFAPSAAIRIDCVWVLLLWIFVIDGSIDLLIIASAFCYSVC